jgi:hypothetical protein
MFDDDASFKRERTIFVCYQFFRQLRNRYDMVAEKPFTQMELDGII